MKVLSIYSDGSAHALAGRPGGWAFAVVRDGEVLLSGSGSERRTTNNVMELHGALAGLQAVTARAWHVDQPVELVSDSQFVITIANGSYLPKKDLSLAHALRAACVDAAAVTRWVRGHSGDLFNEQVDALAEAARQAGMPAAARKRAAAKKKNR